MKAKTNCEIILLEAIGLALDFFDNNIKDAGSFTKKTTNRDLVSRWDILIEEIIKEKLSETNIPIIGEETANNTEYSNQAWVIDPIDGTTNFISGIPFYGISVGLIKDGEFSLGAFGMPKTKELFYVLNDNAFYNEKKIESLPSHSIDNSLISCSFSSKSFKKSHERDKEFIGFGTLNDLSRGCLRTGSAATNICYTAIGKFQAAYGLNAKIWDIAGGLAFARRAGCQIQIQKIDDTKFNYIVGNGVVVEEIAKILTDFSLIDPQQTIKIN